MSKSTFFCIDGHTCGCPVRLVSGGSVPILEGETMSDKRQYFLAEFDWIRTGLMFEPRGHDMMSGSILYPTTRDDCDVAILFIETSGCLPMCGHGTIGTVTFILEQGLIQPKEEGVLKLDTPAGRVDAFYERNGQYIESVRIKNVPSFLYKTDLTAQVQGLGEIKVDVSYGGNFYAIVDPQNNYSDLADLGADEIVKFSPVLRAALNKKYSFEHPENPTINKLTHILWTGQPTVPGATARNAVFLGEKAIDRSPCGTGTSSRMAQWYAQGKLNVGDEFVHESIIHSLFHGRIEDTTRVADFDAIIPSIQGWARQTGFNTIFIDDRDPYARGFSVK